MNCNELIRPIYGPTPDETVIQVERYKSSVEITRVALVGLVDNIMLCLVFEDLNKSPNHQVLSETEILVKQMWCLFPE